MKDTFRSSPLTLRLWADLCLCSPGREHLQELPTDPPAEESLLLKNRSCSSRPLPRTRDLRQLQVWERPVALEAELALTLKVLGTLKNSTLGDILDQPLRTLRHIHSKLQACILFTNHPPSPTGPSSVHSRPQARGHLCQWQHCLQEAGKKESHGYLKASVTFNLFHHLTHDLKYVSDGDLCV
ncbi:Interleukin-29 [Myotis brandtii]|uniref:Interleukin-29 n=1 Tax=Myotis brandtii TaxID=109478 RepID=S7MXK5_MYOBR|nr:Interleukin-29 [Myotis brandtii]